MAPRVTPDQHATYPPIAPAAAACGTTFPGEASARMQSARSGWLDAAATAPATAPAAGLDQVAVLITNTYSDGHVSRRVVKADPPSDCGLDDWWENVIFPETGDGHGGYACHTAIIMAAPRAQAPLVGERNEWQG